MNLRPSFAVISLILCCTQAFASDVRPDQAAFRDLYRELVETNIMLSSGSCTEAAKKMGARLKAAGMREAGIHLLVAPDHPKEGSLVAVLQGGRGVPDEDGNRVMLTMQAGEKLPENCQLEVTNPGGEMGEAMQALAANSDNADALAIVKTDPSYNAVLHTTCLAKMPDAGYATIALVKRLATAPHPVP